MKCSHILLIELGFLTKITCRQLKSNLPTDDKSENRHRVVFRLAEVVLLFFVVNLCLKPRITPQSP